MIVKLTGPAAPVPATDPAPDELWLQQYAAEWDWWEAAEMRAVMPVAPLGKPEASPESGVSEHGSPSVAF